MHFLKVAVIRGGKSHEHEISMSLGAHILKLLRNEDVWLGRSDGRKKKITPIDIYVDKQGIWHKNGAPVDPHKAVLDTDKVISALLSSIDEAHNILELLRSSSHVVVNVPPKYADSILGKKTFAKEYFNKNSIRTPEGATITGDVDDKDLVDIVKKLGFPLIVKPSHGGTSIGVSVAKHIKELPDAISHAGLFDSSIVVEQYITGKEVSIVALRDFREKQIYTTIPLEIGEYKDPEMKKEMNISSTYHHDYVAKTAGTRNYRPATLLSVSEKNTLETTITHIMKDMNLRTAVFDFVVHPKRGVYLLEVNTSVKAYPDSVAEIALKNSGITAQEYLRYLIG